MSVTLHKIRTFYAPN